MNISRSWFAKPGKLLTLAALLVVGCNLFNPAGTGAAEGGSESLLLEAQNAFRDAEYTRAYELFSQAAAADTLCSACYFGMAKAGMRMSGVNPISLLALFNVDSSEIPFVGLPNEEKTTNYKAMRLVDSLLSPLANRDTLTALYDWHKASIADADWAALNLSTADQQRLRTFDSIYAPLDYLGFPLTDRVVSYPKFSAGLAVAKMATELLGFLDLNKDGIISDADLNINITKDADGNITVNLEELYAAAVNDQAVVDNLNDNIDKLGSGMTDLSAVIASMGGSFGLGDDSTTSDGEIQQSAEEQLASLEGAVYFYKMGDKIDNDGDGCVDEEIRDDLDNDGDGFKDEDLRVALDITKDGIDNDQDGMTDEADESALQDNNYLAFTSSFVNNSKGIPNSDIQADKIAVAFDTIPESIQYSLSARRQLIGGCWTFYDTPRFNAWIAAH